MSYRLIILACLLCAAVTSAKNIRTTRQATSKSFPPDFFFGAATASYQVEGAWDEDGKTWSIWDYLVRTDPTYIADGSNGDIAANSYHLYKRDVEMLKELGTTHYRFSIAWTRILPYGHAGYVNPLGVAYYNNLIDELLANGITPFATIYHWDLPQIFSEQGGWMNEDIADWFGDYSRVVFELFGDRVKHWLVINEPFIHCNFGYGYARHAPRVRSPGVGFYQCARNILLANARAYHIYDEEFRRYQHGELGIVLSAEWAYASSDSVDDIAAQQAYLDFHLGLFMDPIFSKKGNYPQTVIERVAAASKAQGLNESRLVPFTKEQIEYIKGTSDFVALNHYTSRYVYRNSSLVGTFEVPSHNDDAFVETYTSPEWPKSASWWLMEHAPGFYNLLMYIKDTYNCPKIYITENGSSTSSGLNDDARVQYLRNYLYALLNAIDQGVDVRGYFAWSLMDNYEWEQGYTEKFGLYQVDMQDPNRTRTPRKAALVYQDIINSRVIDYSYNPDPYATD